MIRSWQPSKELPNKQIMQVLKRTTREEQTVAESVWVVYFCFVFYLCSVWDNSQSKIVYAGGINQKVCLKLKH